VDLRGKSRPSRRKTEGVIEVPAAFGAAQSE
jgi:hypothetical protein